MPPIKKKRSVGNSSLTSSRTVRQCEHGHGFDGGEPDGHGGVAEVMHGREQRGGEGGVPALEHLVADRDDGDGRGQDEQEHVAGEPAGGRGRV